MRDVKTLESIVRLNPAEAAGKRLHRYSARRTGTLIGMVSLVLLASALVAVAQGAVAIPATTIVQMVLAKIPQPTGLFGAAPSWPPTYEAVVLQIRVPRVILAGLVGASLASAGATYQGLFRNPLADPYLIGVASGAGLGAVLALVLPLAPLLYNLGAVQWMAFLGGMLTAAVVYLLAKVGSSTPTTTLLLAGTALGAFASSITSFLMYVHGDKLEMVYSWLLGGFALGDWQQVLIGVPYSLVGLVIVYIHARPLNALQLDEEQAAQLGIDVERVKVVLVGAATLLTATAVSASGLVGFVGLVAPHVTRLIWGPDHRLLLPISALVGATFLIWADTLARTAFAPSEIPVGVVTAFCGAPFFLYLLRQRKRMVF
ncbi:MAG: iron ABC transporter permease [Chloroflexi bacterium]|nr:iron ABC transporter permease [Chloroflexota bacterium]MDA8187781.1 iron ABC transporter permease [Dehalococcoidales bacterium]